MYGYFSGLSFRHYATNQFFSSLRRTTSPTPSFPQLPEVLCIRMRFQKVSTIMLGTLLVVFLFSLCLVSIGKSSWVWPLTLPGHTVSQQSPQSSGSYKCFAPFHFCEHLSFIYSSLWTKDISSVVFPSFRSLASSYMWALTEFRH